MTPAIEEKRLQQNAIELLRRMGYTYISPEEMARYRDSDAQVAPRDILRERLAALNSYEYRGQTHLFDKKRLSPTIDDIETLPKELVEIGVRHDG